MRISGGFVAYQKCGFPPDEFASSPDRDDGGVYEFILPFHNRENANHASIRASKRTVNVVERTIRS